VRGAVRPLVALSPAMAAHERDLKGVPVASICIITTSSDDRRERARKVIARLYAGYHQ
jgi:hypothetical protein